MTLSGRLKLNQTTVNCDIDKTGYPSTCSVLCHTLCSFSMVSACTVPYCTQPYFMCVWNAPPNQQECVDCQHKSQAKIYTSSSKRLVDNFILPVPNPIDYCKNKWVVGPVGYQACGMYTYCRMIKVKPYLGQILHTHLSRILIVLKCFAFGCFHLLGGQSVTQQFWPQIHESYFKM